MCCSVLQCVAVCCSVLKCVAVCCRVLQICNRNLILNTFQDLFLPDQADDEDAGGERGMGGAAPHAAAGKNPEKSPDTKFTVYNNY